MRLTKCLGAGMLLLTLGCSSDNSNSITGPTTTPTFDFAYIAPGIKLIFILSVFWGASALFRGMLSAIRSTHAIAATAGIRLIVTTAVGCTTLFFPDLNGTMVGILAMGGAFITESLVLGWQLYVKLIKSRSIFSPVKV